MANLIDPEIRPGGFGPTEPATEEIQDICNGVKHKVEEKTHKKYDEFKATQYRSQVVNGANFLIKVQVGKDDYIHLSVHRALPCYGGQITLKGVEQHKKKDSPLVPFNS